MCSICLSFPEGSGVVLSACVDVMAGFLPAATVGSVPTVFVGWVVGWVCIVSCLLEFFVSFICVCLKRLDS